MEQKIILLADDDRDDTEMFCEALAEVADDILCKCAINGEELFEQLYSVNILPQVIFLDLNMPVMSGWECLKLLKSNRSYQDIPVVIISTSSHQIEIDKALNLGAVCYLVKPSDFNELKKVLQIITSNLHSSKESAINFLKNSDNSHIYTTKIQKGS